MITEQNDSMFPRLDQDYREVGLTKREYFAALAMSGIMARSGDWNGVTNFEFVAKQAIIVADNLIAELNKEK